jgi:Amt family ammonium transporter
MWVLVTAFLVFFMQAGFMFLEAGFARTRECVNVVLEGIVDTSLCGVLFYLWGFAWMFGHGNGFIGWGDAAGHPWYCLQNLPDTYEGTGVATLAIFLFQFAFADTCSTITSGAMVGRTGFWGDLWYSIGVSGFIYPIFGHWAWGPDGWLNNIPFWKAAPFHDFAGSTVVHTIGGTIALAGAIALGPRLGRKFKRDGGGPMPGHDMIVASVGAIILWFGWYGFNPGSTLSAMDIQGVARVAVNTTLAACTGGTAGQRSTACWRGWWPSPVLAIGYRHSARSSSAQWRVWSSSWPLTCWNTCALTIPAARGPSTARRACGAPTAWASLPPANSAHQPPPEPIIPRRSRGCSMVEESTNWSPSSSATRVSVSVSSSSP